MASSSAGGFFRVLTLIHPPIAAQSVAGGAAAHELPHTARRGAGKRQRLEARLSLRQIDEVLGHAFFAQDALDHLAIAAGADQGALDGSMAARRIEVDVAGDGIVEHQRQVRVRLLDLGFGLRLDARIDRKRHIVGFIDGRRL